MKEDTRLPLLGHLDELRSRMVKVAVALVVGSVVAFVFRNWIFDFLVAPYNDVAAEEELVFFRPTEAFSLFMRLSLWGGFVFASPVLIWQVWAFVAPALNKKERRYVIPLVLALGLLFLAGIAFGYWSLQRGLEFLLDFGAGRLDPTIGADHYLKFAMRFLLVFGIAFEFPVFLFAAAAFRIVDSGRLRRGRRWAVLLIVTIGAVITPSGDPLTLLLLSTPLYVLYEITILLVRFVLKR